MAKYINNINSDATKLDAKTGRGWWTVTADPTKVADGGTVLQEWANVLTLIQALSTDQKLEAVKALGLSTADLITLIQANAVTDTSTLGNIPIGTVENDQRARLRAALQLTDTTVVTKGWLADDRSKIAYYNGNLYGVQRLLYADLTSRNQRPGYEGTNEHRPLNGTGSADFSNTTNQYYTMFFAARNVFSIKLRHTNNNWNYRKLVINQSQKNLTSSSGSYTYNFLPASGWLSVSRLQFVDDGGNTSLDDLQVLYSDSDAPTLTNGQTLAIGDLFRVDGTTQVLRFDGTDAISGAWKASPVTPTIALDAALDPASTNGIENRAVYWAIEMLKRLVDDFLASDRDVEEPRLVLLDLIPDVTIAGNQEVEFRVYIDD